MDLGNIAAGGSGSGFDPTTLTSAVNDLFANKGGLDGLVSQLRAGGLGPQVDSWISTGSNQPADPQQLHQALGPEAIAQLVGRTGIPLQMLLPLLAGILPAIIDHLTPGGQLPQGGGTGSMGDLGGLIGGLLGGAGGAGGLGNLGGLGGLSGLGGLLGGNERR